MNQATLCFQIRLRYVLACLEEQEKLDLDPELQASLDFITGVLKDNIESTELALTNELKEAA